MLINYNSIATISTTEMNDRFSDVKQNTAKAGARGRESFLLINRLDKIEFADFKYLGDTCIQNFH